MGTRRPPLNGDSQNPLLICVIQNELLDHSSEASHSPVFYFTRKVAILQSVLCATGLRQMSDLHPQKDIVYRYFAPNMPVENIQKPVFATDER